MKITIIGIGSIGEAVLKNLSGEGHSVTVIDECKDLVEASIERYDVNGVVGNGACLDIQKEAGVVGADLVIALTRNDELNIFACLVAKRLGVNHTVARVRNPDYRKQIGQMQDALGISMVVNPEMETANEIYNLVNLPSVSSIEHFSKGRAILVEVIAKQGCALIGESLISMGQKLRSKVLVCAIQRGDDVSIPAGDFVIQEGDRIHVTADASKLGEFLEEANLVTAHLRNVMIIGGGKIGFYLADALSRKNYKVKLIEENSAKAENLADRLPRVMVICGNGTQHDLLIEEGIEAMDAFVALTSRDEENIIVSMFAHKRGVYKAITQIENDDLFGMLDELCIDNTISPKQIVASRIASYARALSNSIGSNVQTLYKLVNNRVEALEFAARNPNHTYDTPLRELSIRKNCLIACIIRNNEVLIPDGNSVISEGDNVVVVTTLKNLDDLGDVFE